jgi:hypothetical protein
MFVILLLFLVSILVMGLFLASVAALGWLFLGASTSAVKRGILVALLTWSLIVLWSLNQ